MFRRHGGTNIWPMKALNQIELESMVDHLRDVLLKAPLQEVLVSGGWVLFRFYPGEDFWVLIDLQKPAPILLPFEKKFPIAIKKEKKPLQLFLQAHFIGQGLQDLQVEKEWGRVIRFRFAVGDIEVRLIPRQTNVLVKAAGKTISWDKVQDLKQSGVDNSELECRSLAQLKSEWLAERQNAGGAAKTDPLAVFEKQKAKTLEKKRRAISEIEKMLSENPEVRYRSLGDELKALQSLNVRDDLKPLLHSEMNLAENINAAFAKAKSLRDKQEGTLARLSLIRNELVALERQTFADSVKQRNQKPAAGPAKLKAGEIKLRKRELGDRLVAYMGKSAADNLSLLRKARAWDYWLHLKDYPSAHAILFREKNQVVSPELFRQVGLWIVSEGLSASQQSGDFDLLICESRFVRPIKGDKLGRVHYSNERIQRLRS